MIQRLVQLPLPLTLEKSELQKLREENAVMRELLLEFANSGIRFDDCRLSYVEMQIGKSLLSETRNVLRG